MIRRLTITALAAYCTIATAFAITPIANMTGAWAGPKDLMVNLCDGDNRQQLYVCYCGIHRTYGWADVSMSISGDSLILTSGHNDLPLVGRFRIESDDKLVGALEMGNPDLTWYYNGTAELQRQTPEMPANLKHELDEVILPEDYGVLSLAREKAWEALTTVSPSSYGYSERGEVEQMLNAQTRHVTPEEMIGYRRVRSIQIDARDGIFSYPYFNCRFREVDGKIYFEKTAGSQRKSGYLYQNSPDTMVFLGGWSVNDDPQTSYGSENSVAGMVYKIGPRRAIMIFPSHDDRVEIYELVK